VVEGNKIIRLVRLESKQEAVENEKLNRRKK
jgi:hypothetical protein